jgi:hypothetical protein
MTAAPIFAGFAMRLALARKPPPLKKFSSTKPSPLRDLCDLHAMLSQLRLGLATQAATLVDIIFIGIKQPMDSNGAN